MALTREVVPVGVQAGGSYSSTGATYGPMARAALAACFKIDKKGVGASTAGGRAGQPGSSTLVVPQQYPSSTLVLP